MKTSILREFWTWWLKPTQTERVYADELLAWNLTGSQVEPLWTVFLSDNLPQSTFFYPLALSILVFLVFAETWHAVKTSFVWVWTRHSTPRPSDANKTDPPPQGFSMFLPKHQTHLTRFRQGPQLNPQPCALRGSWYSAWCWHPADGSWTWPARLRPTGAQSTTWQGKLWIWWWNKESGTSAGRRQHLDRNCAASVATTKRTLTIRLLRSLKEWWLRPWSWP